MSPNTPPTNDISPTPTPSISDLTTDYARLAATDQSAEITVSAREARTHQSEEDFRREKEGYVARVDDGEIWKQLTTLDPPFTPRPSHPTNTSDKSTGGEVSADSREGESVTEDQTSTPKPLGRKIFLLVSAAVGELYWEERYEMVIEICDWVEGGYTLDGKMAETVRRWRERCERGGSGVVG